MTGAPPPPPPQPPPPPRWPLTQPATIAPPATAPTADTPNARKRWIGVLVLALVVILVIGIAGTTLFFTRTFPPLAATYDFTEDIRDGNVDRAYAQVCDRLQSASAQDDFETFARRLQRADSISVNFLSVDRKGDTASVDFDSTYDADSVTTSLRLVHEDGDWRPCGADNR